MFINALINIFYSDVVMQALVSYILLLKVESTWQGISFDKRKLLDCQIHFLCHKTVLSDTSTLYIEGGTLHNLS